MVSLLCFCYSKKLLEKHSINHKALEKLAVVFGCQNFSVTFRGKESKSSKSTRKLTSTLVKGDVIEINGANTLFIK